MAGSFFLCVLPVNWWTNLYKTCIVFVFACNDLYFNMLLKFFDGFSGISSYLCIAIQK